jgi:hypothetical protein
MEVRMKKILIYLLIILIFGGIFGVMVQSANNSIKEDAPVISSVLEFIGPAVAYADSFSGPASPDPPPKE